ncbi:MAG: hypothetical protein AB3N20_17635 [Rhizobiaceae bacterium]
MFHMLTCFNLKPGIDLESFRSSYVDFVNYMKSIDLVEGSGQIGERQSDTPMDTDTERDHSYFVIMSFKDRSQVDKAVALLGSHQEPSETAHHAVYSKAKDPIFICWQDLG